MSYGLATYGADLYGAIWANPTVTFSTSGTLTAASTKDAGTSEGTFSMVATMVVPIIRPLVVGFNGEFTIGGTFSEIPFTVSDFSGLKSRTVRLDSPDRSIKLTKSNRTSQREN